MKGKTPLPFIVDRSLCVLCYLKSSRDNIELTFALGSCMYYHVCKKGYNTFYDNLMYFRLL